jgi:hypothetical protein
MNDPLNGFKRPARLQHVSGNQYSVFDNGTHHSPKVSRGCIYELDTSAMTADLVWNYQSTGLYGSHMGSTQVLPTETSSSGGGDVTPGYQPRPDFTEVSEGGQVVSPRPDEPASLEATGPTGSTGRATPWCPTWWPCSSGQNCVQLTYNVFGQSGYASTTCTGKLARTTCPSC